MANLFKIILSVTLLHISNAKPGNIVFIVADDLGYNDVSWHNPDILSPNLEALARSGVILEQAYVQPICTPTRSSLMTGYYPIHTGRQQSVLWPQEPRGLFTNFTLMPQYLKKLGYRTHAIGKWHLGFCNKAYLPTQRGFDSFLGFYTGSQDYYVHTRSCEVGGGPPGYDFRRNEKINLGDNGTYSSFSFAGEAINVITAHSQNHPDKPLFLYLPFQDVHGPLQVPQRFTKKYPNILNKDRKKLSGMVSALDEAVGRIVQTLRATDMLNDTLIVFTADNGGQYMVGGNNWPLRGNKGTVWEGGTRAASFVYGKALMNPGTVSKELIHVSDWVKTLYRFAGGNPREIPGDGFDQWNTIRQGSPSNRRIMLYNIDPGTKENGEKEVAAIRVGDMKLVMGQQGNSGWYPVPKDDKATLEEPTPQETGPWLFNLTADPNERQNLASSHPDIVHDLQTHLASHRASMIPPDVTGSVLAGNPNNFGGFWSTGWCTARPEKERMTFMEYIRGFILGIVQ